MHGELGVLASQPFKSLKCLQPDEAFAFDYDSSGWSTITNANPATIQAEISANLSRYTNCTVRLDVEEP